MTHSTQIESGSDRAVSVGTISMVALMSNLLAKQLTGPTRTLAYRIKAQACSSLIISGNAYVNGVRPGGILSLDIGSHFRMHIRRSHLTLAAQEIADRQAAEAPAVSTLAEILEAKRRIN